MDILAMNMIIMGRVDMEVTTVQVTTTATDDGSGEQTSVRSITFRF
jgi:hypothetical protein